MANSCCQESYTECNKLVTIGYLKTFVGSLIQNTTNGSPMSVNSSDDSYCPTYGDLVGGSLIQNHVAAASGRWSDDVDGITVGGSYASNECVRQEDLSLTYTRFKSLTSSASTTTIGACGGDSTMSYTYTLTRTKKEMNGSCTVDTTNTDGTDTNSEKVTYASSNNAFSVIKPTISVGKNEPTSNCPASAASRNTVISTKVTFRGTEHFATNITITQSALGGSYVFYRSSSSSYTANSYGSWESYEPSGCEGGDYGRCRDVYRDTYTTTWDIENWRDNCETNYYSCTRITNKNGPTRTSRTSAGRDCQSQGTRPNTCSSCCTESSTSYNSSTYYDTLPCTGGSVYVDTTTETAITYYNKSSDDSCSAETCSETYSTYTVGGGWTQTYPMNDRATTRTRTGYVNGRYFRITQEGCPQECDCTPQYAMRGTYNVPASGATNLAVTWAKTYPGCTNTNCISGTATGYVDVPCNSGAARNYPIEYEYADWGVTLSGTVHQLSGTPATCGNLCDCYSATTATGRADSYSSTTCVVKYTLSHRDSNGNWTSSSAETTVNVTPNSTSGDVTQNGTFTLTNKPSCNGDNCGPDVVVSWTATVPGKPCTCADVEPTGTTAITMPQSGGTYQFTYSDCVGHVSWNSSSAERVGRTFTINVDENTTTSSRTLNFVFTFYLDLEATRVCGTYTVEISQPGRFECPDYIFNESYPHLDWEGGTVTFVPRPNN